MALDRIIPYGEPVRVSEIEGYGGREAAPWLTDLGHLLIQAELAAEGRTYLVVSGTGHSAQRLGCRAMRSVADGALLRRDARTSASRSFDLPHRACLSLMSS
jgi:hypothetical protein